MRWRASLMIIWVLLAVAWPVRAALMDEINQAFRSVYGRDPLPVEQQYWAERVRLGHKQTHQALVGAMAYHFARHDGFPAEGRVEGMRTRAGRVAAFKTDKKFYPSAHSPNQLPEGALVKSTSTGAVYYIRDGKKSLVLPRIIAVWLGENHFFKGDIILPLSEAELKAYPTAASVNKLYAGKVLQHPNGSQFYIDDKLRKRPISAAVRGALKFPAKNLYPTSAAHVGEFKTGPAITQTDRYPGGMVIYDGPFHGGRIWKLQESAGGKITKHLYLKDRFYEADGYPDEGQRVGVDAPTLARHERGTNIDQYPDGWLVGLGTDVYLMQAETMRLIASKELFNALGYKDSLVRTEYPELYKKYARGNAVTAFKDIVVKDVTKAGSQPSPAPSAAHNLTKVRLHIRTLIADMNNVYLSVFDKDPTTSENKFWVDYLYNGETDSKAGLVAAMKQSKKTGKKPALTSRAEVLDESVLEAKWFPYLFYFVHQSEPTDDDRDYWFRRIAPGDRDTVVKLGETLQWLKDTSGLTRK